LRVPASRGRGGPGRVRFPPRARAPGAGCRGAAAARLRGLPPPGARARRDRAGARTRKRGAGGRRGGRGPLPRAYGGRDRALRRTARGASGGAARAGAPAARHVDLVRERHTRGAGRAPGPRPRGPRAGALMPWIANPLGLLALSSVAVLIALTLLAR